MAVRQFDGDDYIACQPLGSNFETPGLSIAALVRWTADTSADQVAVALHEDLSEYVPTPLGHTVLQFGCDPSGNLYLQTGNFLHGVYRATDATAVLNFDEWYLIGVTLDDDLSVYFHVYSFDFEEWVVQEAWGGEVLYPTLIDDLANALVWLGARNDTDLTLNPDGGMAGQLAGAAIWDVPLFGQDWENLVAVADQSDWDTATWEPPAHRYELSQESVATALEDQAGSCDQVAIEGTTALPNEDPPIPHTPPPPDTTPPDTSLTGPANGPATAVAFTLTANEPNCTFEVRLNGGAWVPANGSTFSILGQTFGGHNLVDLPLGEHTLEARATDAADNVDPTPASHTWDVTDPTYPIRVIRDHALPPYRLRVLLGREDVTDYIDGDVTYSNVDQGGHEVCAFAFPRPVKIEKGTPIRIEGGLGTLWKGRVAEGGDGFARAANRRQVSGEGMGAVFKEHEIHEIYVDSELSHWGDPSTQRRINLIAWGYSPLGPSVITDVESGAPALLTAVSGGPWLGTTRPMAVALYDSGGVKIGATYAAWKRGSNVNAGDGNWSWGTFLSDTDVFLDLVYSGELRAAGPGAVSVYADTTPRYFAAIQFTYAAAGGASNASYEIYWTVLQVFGEPIGQLPIRSDPGQDWSTVGGGYYPSDIIRDLVARAPGIQPGHIEEASDFVIRQAEWRKPAPLEEAIAQIASYERYAWGTWDAPSILADSDVFDFHHYPDRPTCFLTLARCEGLDLTSRLSDLYNEAIVTYSDTAGRDHLVRVTRDVPELAAENLTRRAIIDLGAGTATTAASFGNFYLALQERIARASGSFTTRGLVRTRTGEKYAHALRAGKDAIRISDVPQSLAFGRPDFQIKRVSVTANRQGASAQVEIGAGADLLPVLQARMANAVKAG